MTILIIKTLFIACGMFLLFSMTAGAQSKTEEATFAGGCFWCMQPAFEKIPGVIDVVSGYEGGTGKDPT